MITHVAIWRNDTIYALPNPNRHHNVFTLLSEADQKAFAYEIQGFLATPSDLKQRLALFGTKEAPKSAYDLPEGQYFLGRHEAFIYAKFTKQIQRNSDPKSYQGCELFSEDLW